MPLACEMREMTIGSVPKMSATVDAVESSRA